MFTYQYGRKTNICYIKEKASPQVGGTWQKAALYHRITCQDSASMRQPELPVYARRSKAPRTSFDHQGQRKDQGDLRSGRYGSRGATVVPAIS